MIYTVDPAAWHRKYAWVATMVGTAEGGLHVYVKRHWYRRRYLDNHDEWSLLAEDAAIYPGYQPRRDFVSGW